MVQDSTIGYAMPKITVKDVETDGENPQHVGVLNAFADHIKAGTPLVADGREGINGLMISNAMYLSSWLDRRYLFLLMRISSLSS